MLLLAPTRTLLVVVIIMMMSFTCTQSRVLNQLRHLVGERGQIL